MINNLMVTIQCITYNHEPYIRQCLDGFVMQKTNFRFEAIVHDDASTDGTAAIIKEYAEKYPDIIKPIFETENQYSKKDGSLTRIMNEHTHGKYVAICEGDDYWIDPLKLQKQVNFMESNPECTMSFHKVKIDSRTFEDNRKCLYNKLEEREYSSLEIFSSWCVPTASVVIRKGIPIIRDPRFVVGDNPLFLSCAKVGKVYCMSTKVMAAYRLLSSGAVASGIEWRKQIEHFVAISEHFGNAELNEEVKGMILSVYVNAFLNGKFSLKSIRVLYKLCSSNIEILPAFIRRIFAQLSEKW